MTQMHAPYNQESGVELHQESERTSVMAILSLVFGVGGCCLGLTSIPAILLGIFSLVGISRSRGRVGGTGFGIAGILVGLMTLALWGGMLGAASYSLGWMEKNASGPTTRILLDIEAGRFDAARLAMTSPAADVSDEELILFREAYLAELGSVVSETHGIGELIMGYAEVGQHIQNYNGRLNHIPMPIVFDSGMVLVVLEFDPVIQESAATDAILPMKIIIVNRDGNEYILPMSTGTNLPADPIGSDPEQDAEIEAPADDEP